MSEISLESRLREVEDQLALNKLMTNYLNLADQRRWDEWVLCFTEDAVFNLPNAFGRMEGRDNIYGTCVGAMEGTWANTQHMIVNMDFDVEGDEAKGTANIIFIGMPDDSKPEEFYMMGGRYRWKFIRTIDGWRIADAWEEFLWNNGNEMKAVFKAK